ncbi:MAG: hypothetical protein QM231_02505 [Chloroflexota bacterium]|nr:hypothetical protein [Chloroflexota bacterium]
MPFGITHLPLRFIAANMKINACLGCGRHFFARSWAGKISARFHLHALHS